jgi:hypothetical protein
MPLEESDITAPRNPVQKRKLFHISVYSRIPWYLGYCRQTHCHRWAICYPWGLNLVMRLVHTCVDHLRFSLLDRDCHNHEPKEKPEETMKPKFRLCYVNRPWAWFTTQDVRRQRGEDWDVPGFTHNAGDPEFYHEASDDEPYELLKVAVDGTYVCPYHKSVEDINHGVKPWLRMRENDGRGPVTIYAGVTLEEFINQVHAGGGEVYSAPAREA